MRSMRNPRKTFEERSNPEGVTQRVTAGVSTSLEQLCHPFGVDSILRRYRGLRARCALHSRLFMCRPVGAFSVARWCGAKPRMGRHINSRGWSMRSMRNPRKTFEERSNPEGVTQRVTAGVSTSSEQLCHPFGVRFNFAPIPGVERASPALPPAINVPPRRGFFGRAVV